MTTAGDWRLSSHREALRAIGATIESAAGGDQGGALIVVTGRAGIGKSHLLGAVAGQAVANGLVVRRAAADGLSRSMPAGVVGQLLGSDVSLPARTDDEEQRLAEWSPLGHSLTADLLRSAEELARRPGVWIVDDAQLCDRWSLLLLDRMARTLADRPVVLLLAMRADAETTAALDHLVRPRSEVAVQHVELGPLGMAEVLALARRRLGVEPGPHVRDLLKGTGGNPLFVTQLLRALEKEAVRDIGRAAKLRTEISPTDIEGLIDGRLRSLGRVERDLIAYAALFGRSFDAEDLAVVLGRTAMDLGAPLRELVRAGFLVDDGRRLSFGHELVRAAVAASHAPNARRALHRQIAERLEDHGAREVDVLHHLVESAERGDESIADRVLVLARDLETTDPRQALELLDRAARIATDPKRLARIDLARAVPLAWSGALADAIRRLEIGVDSLRDPEERARRRWLLAGVLILANRAPEAIEQIHRAVDETDDRVTQARLVAEEALARLAIADPLGEDTARSALARGEQASDPVSQVAAHCAIARLVASRHRYREGAEHTNAAVALADDDPSRQGHRMSPWFYHGCMLLDLEDGAGVRRAIRSGRALVEAIGNHWADPFYCGLAASLALREARLDEASAEALAGIALADDTGTHAVSGWCHAIEAHVRLLRDEVDHAGRHVESALEHLASGHAPFGIDFVVRAQALVAEACGDAEAALVHLRGGWELFEALGVPNCMPLLGPDLARLEVLVGDPARAESVASELRGFAADADAPSSFSAIAERTAGLASGDRALLEAALASYPAGRTLDRLHCHVELLELEASGTRTASTPDPGAVAELSATMRAVEAPALARRVRAILPEPAVEGSSERDEPLGWDQLTAAERQVAELVATGATNAEIARDRGTSVRTVETQLYRTYHKLGISSRTKLALLVADAGRPT